MLSRAIDENEYGTIDFQVIMHQGDIVGYRKSITQERKFKKQKKDLLLFDNE